MQSYVLTQKKWSVSIRISGVKRVTLLLRGSSVDVRKQCGKSRQEKPGNQSLTLTHKLVCIFLIRLFSSWLLIPLCLTSCRYQREQRLVMSSELCLIGCSFGRRVDGPRRQELTAMRTHTCTHTRFFTVKMSSRTRLCFSRVLSELNVFLWSCLQTWRPTHPEKLEKQAFFSHHLHHLFFLSRNIIEMKDFSLHQLLNISPTFPACNRNIQMKVKKLSNGSYFQVWRASASFSICCRGEGSFGEDFQVCRVFKHV